VLSHGKGARPGVERMRSATNHSGWLGHRKSRGPNQGSSEGCREFSLSGSLPCLPALSCIDTDQGCSSLRLRSPRKPPFSGRDDTTARLPPSLFDRPLDYLSSLAVGGGSEKLRSADVLQQFERGVEVRRGSVNG
jgi:hypothetical protein